MFINIKDNFSNCGNSTFKVHPILKRRNDIIKNKKKIYNKDLDSENQIEELQLRINKFKSNNNNKNIIKIKLTPKKSKRNKNYYFNSSIETKPTKISTDPPIGSYNMKYNLINKNSPNIIFSKLKTKNLNNMNKIANNKKLPSIKNIIKIKQNINYNKMFGRSKFNKDFLSFLSKNRISKDSKLHYIDINLLHKKNFSSIISPNLKKQKLGKRKNIKNYNILYEPNYDYNKKKIIKNIIFN